MRLLVLMLAMAIVVAACGGDSTDAESDNGGDQTDTTTVATTEPAADDGDSAPMTTTTSGSTTESDDTAEAEGSGPSTASVTLGNETYEFSTEGAIVAQCLTDLFGVFSVQLPMVDDSGATADGSVAIVALREGTDPETVGEVNSVQVDVGDETWVADEADDLFEQSDLLEPGMSQVDSLEIDGRTVRGTATFVRQNSLFGGGEAETATGSFEATCGEERTS